MAVLLTQEMVMYQLNKSVFDSQIPVVVSANSAETPGGKIFALFKQVVPINVTESFHPI